jgi:hypothetical protein
MARVAPLLELYPDGGQVVVTRFECGSVPKLLVIRLLHASLKRAVRRTAPGFIAIRAIIDWRRRTMLSISLWEDLESIYAMGNVPRHVSAARVPSALGVATTCGIYYLVGDWRRVMFGGTADTRSPLYPLPKYRSPAHASRRDT